MDTKPNPPPTNRPRAIEAQQSRGFRLREHVGLLSTSVLLIAAVAVVQPESFFLAPRFRLGAGIPKRTLPQPWEREVRSQPDFICLMVLGGLRADLPSFGDQADGTLRVLESFAADSTFFEFTCAQASNPRVSLKSLLSGRYPANVILEETGADQRSLMGLTNPRSFLRETFAEAPTSLGTWLESAGYQTTAFSDAEWVQNNPSFGEGFAGSKRAIESPLIQGARWLQQLPQDSPRQRQALILHLEELLPAETPARLSKRIYAKALAKLDADLGVFIEALEQQDLWDQSAILLTSDHGTSLGERGLVGHGQLYLEQLMVPLCIKFPGAWQVPPGPVYGAVELVDLLPTIQALCGELEPRGDGRSILPIPFRHQSGRKLLIAQTSSGPWSANPTTRSAIAPGKWQLIQDARGDGLLFYALEADPQALQPVQPGKLRVPRFVTQLFTKRAPE